MKQNGALQAELELDAAPVLVTGAAGFIGFHVAARLLRDGCKVVGYDNLNSYYDPCLKEARLAHLNGEAGFTFCKDDLADLVALNAAVGDHGCKVVLNLAAQAGVRYSIENPRAYVDSNLVGFANVLEVCRRHEVKHLVYASSSSVYGANDRLPFSTKDSVDHPVSLYAATKKSDELMAHSYSHLFNLPTTGLRFFTVYGPWGRPDMAFFKFAKAILGGKPIDVYNGGDMSRDFTYVDDIVEGVLRVLTRPPAGDTASADEVENSNRSKAPYRIYNIGCGKPVQLSRFIDVLEMCLGRKAERNLLPLQPGDMKATCADVSELARDTGFRPTTTVEEGISRFVDWYVAFYGPPGVEDREAAVG